MPSPSDPRRLSGVPPAEPPDADAPDDGGDDDSVVDIEYRGRGRPRLPPEQKRREKLVVALTADELKRFMIEAAEAEGGPLRVQDWARRVLLAASKRP